jgi:hypothetical protein
MIPSNSDNNKFLITFIDIFVEDDGDDFSKGEIFYTFKVDNEVIFETPPSRPAELDSGTDFQLYPSQFSGHPNKEILKNHDESFTVYGMVGEEDDFATGDNDIAGSFLHTYNGVEGWWDNDAQIGSTKNVSVRLNGDGMSVTINYSIKYITGDEIIDLGNQETPPPTPRNIADGGVILYQGEHFISNIRTLISPSQFFGLGDYNLPTDIRRHGNDPFGTHRPFEFIVPGLPPNTASSIKVGSSIQVTLYDKIISERHLGTNTILFSNEPLLRNIPYSGLLEDGENGWNNKVVSIKVEVNDFQVS